MLYNVWEPLSYRHFARLAPRLWLLRTSCHAAPCHNGVHICVVANKTIWEKDTSSVCDRNWFNSWVTELVPNWLTKVSRTRFGLHCSDWISWSTLFRPECDQRYWSWSVHPSDICLFVKHFTYRLEALMETSIGRWSDSGNLLYTENDLIEFASTGEAIA